MNRKTNITEKELQDLSKELQVNGITKTMIAEDCNKSLRYISAVFSISDERYSEEVITKAKKLLVKKSTNDLNDAVKKHSSTMKLV